MKSFGDEKLQTSPQTSLSIICRTPLSAQLAKLRLTDGTIFAVCSPICRIGQDESNDIVICEDDEVARFHAQITLNETDSEYILRDLGTRCGTFLNGSKLQIDEVIFGGDQIKIGKYRFYFDANVAMETS